MTRNTVLTSLFCLGFIISGIAPVHAGKVLNKEAVIGAATGGTAGGIIGHQTGHKTEGAILGTIAGYAIGTTINRQKQRQRHVEHQQGLLQARVATQEEALAHVQLAPPAEPRRPELTQSERQQLLLQARPLFRVDSAR
jgi:membrane protein YqaA with SNARE-associated domain